MTRTDLLKAYLKRLAIDAAADGKFAGAGSDRAAAVARALISGSGGMLVALLEDVKRVAGDGRIVATSAVTGLATRAVDGAVRAGIDKLVEAASVALNKGKREQRATGKALMRAAKEMER